MTTDPTLDPERRMWYNSPARKERVERRRARKQEVDKRLRRARKMIRMSYRACVRCGEPGPGKTFRKLRICKGCWRLMTAKEKAAVSA